MDVAKISFIYLKKQRFWNNGTCILPEIAITAFEMSSRFNGLEKTKLEPEFEVSSSKNKDLVTQYSLQERAEISWL